MISDGTDLSVHERKCVVGKAGANSGNESAGKHHQEHQGNQTARPTIARLRVPRAGRSGGDRSNDSAVQNIAPNIKKASPRCAVRRSCDTRGSSTRPLCTMYQPSAPCSPPSTKYREQPWRVSRRNPAARREPHQRNEENDADRTAEQAMEIFPPENALERIRGSCPLLTCAYSGVAWYFANASFQSAADSGGKVPTIGCHSVIDKPEWVSRVTPPTTTIANTSAQQRSSHAPTAPAPPSRRRDCAARPVRCSGAAAMSHDLHRTILPHRGSQDRSRREPFDPATDHAGAWMAWRAMPAGAYPAHRR